MDPKREKYAHIHIEDQILKIAFMNYMTFKILTPPKAGFTRSFDPNDVFYEWDWGGEKKSKKKWDSMRKSNAKGWFNQSISTFKVKYCKIQICSWV